MSAQPQKIKSNWWYSLPIFLGVIGGIVVWLVVNSLDRKLAKNCLVLGIIFTILELSIFITILTFSDNLNIVTEFGPISDTEDLDIQFKFNTP